MIRPIIFALGLLAFISVASALESNPIVKIDKYLSRRTNNLVPSVSFELAEEYYEAEKQAKHKLTSNKKLLEALEDFLGLKQLIDGDKKENCNIQAIEKLNKFGKIVESNIQSINELDHVYRKIKEIYADGCRKEFYAILDRKLDTMKDVDQLVAQRLHDLMEVKMFPSGRQSGESEYSVNALYKMIINKEDTEIFSPQHIQDSFRNCDKNSEKNPKINPVQICWINPCQKYIDQLRLVFRIATEVDLKPDVHGVEKASPETQRYFEHWAQFRACHALLNKGAFGLKRDYLGQKISFGNGDGSDII